MDIAALASELTVDPLGRGYSGMSNAEATASLNTVNRDVDVTSITGDRIFAATDSAEFIVLSDIKKQLWLSFCGRSEVDPFGTSNVAFVTWLFGGGSTTGSNLAGVRQQSISRAQELGLGIVREGDVERARV